MIDVTSWSRRGPVGSDRSARSRFAGAVASAVACVTLGALIVAAPGAGAVVAEQTLTPLGGRWGDDSTREGQRAARGSGTWKADRDLGSTWSIAGQVGARAAWDVADPSRRGATITGRGVSVALLDTGIAPVEGLLGADKVVRGPDLSFDSQDPATRGLDGFGHGTHLAGIIAGRDPGVRAGREDDARHFVGIAPDARLVDVRVGAGDGAVDVSQVVAGIDWVVGNREALGIRVLNLSYGTDSVQPYEVDPLAHAVESAWRAGIVVVVAAGNDGQAGPSPLTMPAADPFVIAVGSSDHQGSPDAASRVVGAWTNTGTDARRPDLLAPGKSVVSLRVPGSAVDVEHPEGLVARDRSGRLFRGTGTSQSAAVVSGAVALLLQRDPSLTPDQVKGLLLGTADPLSGSTSPVQGAGVLDLTEALAEVATGGVPAHTQTMPASTGLGSLQLSRGSGAVVDPEDGAALTGEQDVFGVAWDAAAWAPLATLGRSWSGDTWRGSDWSGSSWSGRSWSGRSWSGRSWSGRSWSGRSWSGRSWSGRSWSGRSWSGRSWSGRSWSADDWSGRSWSGRSWSSDDWSGRSWS